jgi:hypothetical protein
MVLSIVYSSTATVPFGDDELVGLLATSRDNNAVDGLTGMLLFHDGRFLQVLEGPDEAVRSRLGVIAVDERHTDVRVLLEEELNERRFPDWTMGFQPYEPGVSDEIPGYLSSFGEPGVADEQQQLMRALRELLGWFDEQSDAAR